ncbi:MAG TPA: hypothetical protein DDW71_04190 [Lactobacillus sp.]|nr:hypothetical protein [Lactobacillus sp.]
MRRFGYDSRLFRDSLDEKRHYKMYKKGKMWLVAGISLFSSSLAYSSLNGVSVKADTVNTTATADTPAASADTSAGQDATDQSADKAATPVATQTDADSASTSAAADTNAKAATPAASTDTSKTAHAQAPTTDPASAPKAATDASANASDATAAANAAVKSAAQTSADQTATTPKTTDATATKAAADATGQITEYSKEAGQNLIQQAAKAQAQVQDYLTQSNALADANANDNIPQDDALAALASHQAAETASVNDAVTSADAVAATDKQTALDNLNKALTVVDNMTNEVEQAGVLLAADKKGVQANVVTNAQNAYEKVSLPSGVTTKLDAYGDLIVTASSQEAYQSVLANLNDAGLIGSFRNVVDPLTHSYSVSFANAKYADGTNAVVANADGSATFVMDGQPTYAYSLPVNFSYSGNKGDVFYVTIPASLSGGGQGYTSQATVTGGATSKSNADGSVTYSWTVATDGESTTQTVNLTDMGSAHYIMSPNMVVSNTATLGVGGPVGTVADQTVLPLKFGYAGVAKVANGATTIDGTGANSKSTSITIQNTAKISNISFGAFYYDATKKKVPDTDYTYSVVATVPGTQYTSGLQTSFNNVDLEINVPKTFLLDSAKTENVNMKKAITNAPNIEITQPGGVGTSLVVKTKPGLSWNVARSNLFFAGSYAAGTTGQQTFSVKSMTYSKNAGNPVAPVAKDDGAESAITPKSSALNGIITFDGTSTNLTETVAAKESATVGGYIQNINNSNELAIGNKTSNVLNDFGIRNTGTVAVNAKITMTLPDTVESTGLYIPPFTKTYNTVASGDTYNVVVNFTDGTKQSFDGLKEGTTLSTLAQTGTVNSTKMFTVPTGASVKSYEITPQFKIDPGDTLFEKVGEGGELNNGPWIENDINAGSFSTLGYVKEDTPDGTIIPWKLDVTNTDDNSTLVKTITAQDKAVKNSAIGLDVMGPSHILQPNETFNVQIGDGNNTAIYTTPNLNANGVYANGLLNNNNDQVGINTPSAKDGNDQPGFAGVAVTKVDPVFYVTTPEQTKLVTNTDGSLFTKKGAGWTGVTATPKVTTYTNADGQSVYKLDYTGTGFEFNPVTTALLFNFKVNADAITKLQPFTNTKAENNTYNGRTYNVASASKGGTDGESTAVVMLAGNDQDGQFSTYTNTFDQADANNLFTTLTDASGKTTKVTGLSTFDGKDGMLGRSLGYNFADQILINAPEGMNLSAAVQDNQNYGSNSYSPKGVNNPMTNDQQKLRLRLSNNTANGLTNVASVLNLPQDVTASTATTPGKFKLVQTGAGTFTDINGDGNTANILYSTQTMQLSNDGKFVTLANGHKYYFNTADGTSDTTASDLVKNSAITDWSTVKSVLAVAPTLSAYGTLDTFIPVKDPASATDKGKQVTIETNFRADGKINVKSDILDTFATTANIKYVDQDGHEINGFPEVKGGFDANGAAIEGTPTGAVGDPIPTASDKSIPGYIFVSTDGDKNFTVNGDATVVNHYQVDEASLTTTNKPGGTQVNETAKGDATPNTTTGDGSATATGTAKITFTNTDAKLAVPGYTYTVSVNGGTPVATLADALTATPNYDTKLDDKGATQKFVVTYKVADKAIQVGTLTKVYDNDASTDPFSYTVTLPTGLKQPTWKAADFTTPTKQDASATPYSITLSAQGLTDLKTANPGFDFTSSMVTPGSLTITPAPITITAPSDTKTFDGHPFDQTALAGKTKVTGAPAKGVAPVYTLDSVAGDTAVGSYTTNVTPDSTKNTNYKITTEKGTLTITPVGALTAKISDHTKVYDGTTTDTQNGGVYDVTLTGAAGLAPITWAATDFTVQNVQPDVGTYQVVLSKAGQDKLTAAAKGYTFDPAKNVTAGSFKITPAPITITGPTDTKTYDGNPFDATALKAKVTIDGVSGSMKAPVYTLGDVSADTAVGSYDSTVTAKDTDNPDYTIKTANGKLTITPVGELTAAISSHTKVYDGTATDTNGGVYDVTLTGATGLASITWAATDFMVQDVQPDVGTYQVVLTKAGQDKLTAVAKGYTFDPTKNVTAGSFKITPAPITITGPTDTKTYDGNPFDSADLKSKTAIDGVSGSMKTPVYTLNDVSGDVNVGNYDSVVTASATDNPNYTVKTVNGKLTINPINLTQTPPNDPKNPSNPKTPNDNQPLATSVVVQGATKVYDGDQTTDPTTYKVVGPTQYTDFTVPTLTADDFDISGITSQDIGNYVVKLSDAGITKIQAANPNYKLDASDIQNGLFVITPAPLTVTGPTLTKVYDGQPYTGADLKATVTGVPTKGTQPVVGLGDISADVNVSNTPYVVPITADASNAANKDYTFTLNNGTLTITPLGLTQTPPNDPKNPSNPKTPNDNQPLATSVVVQGATKVYDGDATTDPTTFNVVGPTQYTDFTIPTLTADDFDTSGITGQDVGNYVVKLSDAGVTKIQAANPNYKLDASDIQNGLFVITPAPVTITAPSASKVFDGQPYTGDLTAKVDGVPAKGVPADYSLTDVSGDTNVGSYDINVVTDNTKNTNYTVKTVSGKLTITPAGQLAITMVGKTKVYDGDVTTDPTTYDVTLPTGVTAPTWTADDFDLSGITSQNVGSYNVTLSDQGITDLQAKNPNFTVTKDEVTGAKFTITKAPVTVTAPTLTKVYDGNGYTDPVTATETGVPTKGDKLKYTLTDVTGDKNVGDYPITVTDKTTDLTSENPNYDVTVTPGKLTITPLGLTQTPPNEPKNPSNPKTPNDNQPLATSVVVQGAIKVYDGDALTDPTTFNVVGPTQYTDFTIPTLTADDFDTSGITSQDVNNYVVKLSDAGVAKIQAANPNYKFDASDIQNGLFVIKPAPVMVKGQSGSKVYDGSAFTDAQLAGKGEVIGKPSLGKPVNFALTDISNMKDVGTYKTIPTVDASANPDYLVTPIDGQLSITPLGLEQTPPNEPGKPTNPDEPNNNPALEASVVVQGGRKVYDNDSSTTPNTFKVLGPTGDKYATFVMPTFDASDFDTTNINQNAGTYKVTLTQAGIDKLVAANKNFTIKPEDIQNGLYIIDKAPVMVKGQSGTKVYDGSAFTDSQLTSTGEVLDKPALGVAVNYNVANISNIKDVGTYTTTPTLDGITNDNYLVTPIDGQLSITPMGLEQTPPNEPGKPTNPDEPNNNPALDASVVVQGARKVYDNDPSNTPKTFNVLKPTGAKYATFVMPTFDASDFKIDGLTQDVNQYKVELTQSGIDKLVATNKNFTIKPEDIQNGLYVIDPAPVMVKGQSGTKVYDGSAFTDAQLAGKGEVIGKPSLGKPVNFTLTDISNMKDVGTYKTIPTVDASANSDYLVTPIDGQLSITPLGLEQTPPNEPDKPTNPDEPNNNPALEASVVVQGGRKVYDNDPSTTPATFKVLGPTGTAYSTFVMPTFDASDFTTDINQNAGTYKVTLTQTGIDKLVAANKNFTIKPEDIQNGLYVIDKAPVMVKGQSGTKVYDGSAFTDSQLTSTGEVIGKPALGVAVNYNTAKIDGIKDVGTYTTTPTLDGVANDNYLVTPIDGQLSITPLGLQQTPPNEPGKPTNPDKPNNNPALEASVVVQGGRKVYDNDPSTTPSTFKVLGPTGTAYATFVMPTFDASDFTTDINQNAGTYKVTLTQAGIDKLVAANKNFTIKPEDIQNGLYVIDPAPVMVKGQSGTKTYDGNAFTDSQLTSTGEVIGKPALGVAVNYNVANISNIKNVGTYTTTPTLDGVSNDNYLVTPIDGQLNITQAGLTTPPDNTPSNPSNPKTPNDNQPLATSVVVEGATKVYDGDASTDPTTFKVAGPTQYTDFTVPTLTADDFDTSGINSQDVDNYVVKLSAAGLAKIQATNPNYKLDASDVQNGLFVITPAPLTITGPTVEKYYDGQPYPASQLTGQVTGQPTKGINPVYSFADISGDVNVRNVRYWSRCRCIS